METRASYVLIGAFVLTTVTLAVVSILWFGKLSLDREWDWYDVVFTEAVTGLTTGGAVQYNGIQVGDVRRLSLDANDPRKAIARIRAVAGTPIKVDTQATLSFTGLTGVSIIQLSGGTPQAPRLRPKDDAEVAVIVAEESALQSLLVSGGGMLTRANELLLRLSSLLRDENISALSGTFRNLDTISSSVAVRSDDIDKLLKDLPAISREFRAAVGQANTLLANLDDSAVRVRELVGQDGPRIVAQAQQTLHAARQTLRAAQQASDRWSALLEENRGAISAFVEQGLADVAPAVNELRATLRPLRDLARRLENEPGLILQPPTQPREVAPP